MLFADMIHSQSETLLALVVLVILVAAGELGCWQGRRKRAAIDEATRSQTLTIQGAILGLLGLLLGFTLAMAVGRFETRKQLMVDEANALGTAYLRAQLLPDPEQVAVRGHLREYLEVRRELTRPRPDSPSLTTLTERCDRLQAKLWAGAVAAAQRAPESNPISLFVQSLNQAIDVAGLRDAAMDNHIPENVLLLLALVAILAVGIVGYGSGFGTRRPFLVMLALSFSIAVVMLIIIDLDRPRRGLNRVSEQRLLELKQSWERGY